MRGEADSSPPRPVLGHQDTHPTFAISGHHLSVGSTPKAPSQRAPSTLLLELYLNSLQSPDFLFSILVLTWLEFQYFIGIFVCSPCPLGASFTILPGQKCHAQKPQERILAKFSPTWAKVQRRFGGPTSPNPSLIILVSQLVFVLEG